MTKLKPGQRDATGRLFIGYHHRYWSENMSMSTVMPTAEKRGGPYKHFANCKITRLFRKPSPMRKALMDLVEAINSRNAYIGGEAWDALERAEKVLGKK